MTPLVAFNASHIPHLKATKPIDTIQSTITFTEMSVSLGTREAFKLTEREMIKLREST